MYYTLNYYTLKLSFTLTFIPNGIPLIYAVEWPTISIWIPFKADDNRPNPLSIIEDKSTVKGIETSTLPLLGTFIASVFEIWPTWTPCNKTSNSIPLTTNPIPMLELSSNPMFKSATLLSQSKFTTLTPFGLK